MNTRYKKHLEAFKNTVVSIVTHSRHFKCIEKFKSLTFQLRAIWFHTFAVDMIVYTLYIAHCRMSTLTMYIVQ